MHLYRQFSLLPSAFTSVSLLSYILGKHYLYSFINELPFFFIFVVKPSKGKAEARNWCHQISGNGLGTHRQRNLQVLRNEEAGNMKACGDFGVSWSKCFLRVVNFAYSLCFKLHSQQWLRVFSKYIFLLETKHEYQTTILMKITCICLHLQGF